jgi:hypothetical protein
MNDRFRDRSAEPRHTLSQPRRNTTAMKRKIRDAGAFHKGNILTTDYTDLNYQEQIPWIKTFSRQATRLQISASIGLAN